jgi:hypothetical protein
VERLWKITAGVPGLEPTEFPYVWLVLLRLTGLAVLQTCRSEP